MSLNITHQPAFNTVYPDIEWKLVSTLQAKQLNEMVGNSGDWQVLTSSKTFPEGYFCLTRTNMPNRFIKIVSKQRSGTLLASDEVAIFLCQNGINTPQLLSYHDTDINGKTWSILQYKAFELNPVKLTDQHIIRVAGALGELHKVLSSFKCSSVKLNTQPKLALVHKTLTKCLGENSVSPERVPTSVMKIAKQWHGNILDSLLADPQVIHGDLNLGNIRQHRDEQICFLDFENSLSSYFSPLFDLSYIVTRMIVMNEQAIDKQTLLVKCLSEYFHQVEHISATQKATYLQRLPNALIATNTYCLLVLISHLEDKSSSVDAQEWQKFINFHYQLLKSESMIKQACLHLMTTLQSQPAKI